MNKHEFDVQLARNNGIFVKTSKRLVIKTFFTMKKIIHSPDAPAAVGPYSQAVEANGFVFISGQVPLMPGTGKLISSDIREQTRQVMDNIKQILKTAGCGFKNVVKCTCLLSNIEDFQAMNEVYADYFDENPPARAAFEVGALPLGAKVEIETIAVKPVE